MIVLEKSHQNLSDYIQFSFIFFYLTKEGIIFSEKIRNSCNYNYDYAHSFLERIFHASRYTGMYVYLNMLTILPNKCPRSVKYSYFSVTVGSGDCIICMYIESICSSVCMGVRVCVV